ncbi:MAG: tellurite resistance TerB family protein [Marinovum sp.]|nr:tellurite resistance TerB family protein [Marinovum sp.]
MGLMGTLAKVAIGYAAARGVDQLSQNGGLGGLLGGAKISSGNARAHAGAASLPGMDQLQKMMGGGSNTGGNPLDTMMGMMGDAGGTGGLQDMMSKLTVGAGTQPGMDMASMMQSFTGGAGGGMQEMMAKMMGGGSAEPQGDGLLSSGGGAGLASLLAMAGATASASGQGAGALLDAFNTKETAPQAEEAAELMLRAMIQAAKSDGGIDETEEAKIMDLVGEDADAEDIAFVRAQLAVPIDIAGLARATPDMQKTQVYSMSLMTIRVDTQAEANYLDELAEALGLNQGTINALHVQMGVQPLYD